MQSSVTTDKSIFKTFSQTLMEKKSLDMYQKSTKSSGTWRSRRDVSEFEVFSDYFFQTKSYLLFLKILILDGKTFCFRENNPKHLVPLIRIDLAETFCWNLIDLSAVS
jgi:hypothetical protein